MDFDQAIRAHADWRLKLSSYVARPNGTLNPAELQRDDHCSLGRWIHGDGLAHAAVPEFAELQAVHARLHEAAAELVKRADAGEDVSGEIALGASGPFAVASGIVITALLNMRRTLGH